MKDLAKHELIKKLKNNTPFRYAVTLMAIFLLYKFYVWVNTETTDNAYVQADITLISSEINGKVVDIFIKENTRVKKGDVIARIDDTEYKAALEQSTSKLQSAEYALLITEQKIVMEQTNLEKLQENLKYAQVSFDLAERDYKRNLSLIKNNFSSQKVLDVSKSTLEQARNALSRANIEIKASQENTEMLSLQKKSNLSDIETAKQAQIIAKKNMDNTFVISPVDGITASSGLRKGNFVVIGMPMIYVVPLNMYIIGNFKETQVARFKNGMDVKIEFDALPGKYYGKIRNVSPASGATFSLIPVDNATGNFTKIVQRIPVTIDFDYNQSGLENISIGMSVSLSVDTR